MSNKQCNAIYIVLTRFASDETEDEEEQLLTRLGAITDFMQNRGIANHDYTLASYMEYFFTEGTN